MSDITVSLSYIRNGDVAQMVEHSLSMRGARGSIPRISMFFIVCPLFSLMPSIPLSLLFDSKKRQRQGSNLRSQREIA